METEITDIGKVAITPRKDYKNEHAYEWLDVVTYDGASYMCIAEDGCTGIVPTNTDYWQLLADKGHFTEEDKEEFKKAVVEESKTEINEHTDNKKTELNNYTTELEKSLENELDAYKTEKEAQLDLYKATLETEMANKKDSLIEEIETAQNGFDTNVEEKTNTFNSNVETKTTEFNNNSNAKTEEFNNNSTEKINAFNSNAEEKIADYDEHVEALTSRIADLEEETEDLFNALDTEKANGTELYIEDAKPCRIMNTEIGGMYKQETTNGTNLMNLNVVQNSKVTVNEDGTITINGTGGFNLAFESFTFKANIPYYIKWEIVPGTVIQTNNSIFRTPDNLAWAQKDKFTSFSVAEDKTLGNVWIHKDANFENAKIRIWISESQSDFEPYTGAIASPSPDYPQVIEQVEEIKYCITGKNCYDISKFNTNTQMGSFSGHWIYLKENTTYTISTNIVSNPNSGNGLQPMLGNPQNQNAYIAVTTDITASSLTSKNGVGTTNQKARTVTTGETGAIFVGTRNAVTALSDMVSQGGYIQIEEGIVATEYEEYKEQKVNIDLKGNKLCAISDTIKDKLLIDRNGNIAIQKNVDMYTITGNEKIEFLLSNGISQLNFDMNCRLITNQGEDFSALSNFFKKEKVWGGSWFKDNICIQRIAVKKIRLQSSKFTTIDEAKDFFKQQYEAGNPVIIYFQAESKLIDLGQLTELQKTFEGINNIWAETNLGNTEIEIEYVQDVKKLLEKQAEQQNARLDNIETLLSTTQTSALLLDNMQNDLEKEVE